MTVVADEIDTLAALGEAWARLRALKVIDDEGWARVVALDLAEGRHVLALDDGHYRTLLTSEVYWWGVGAGDSQGGHGDLVTVVRDEPVPELLTLAEAARRIPSVSQWGALRDDVMTPEGVSYSVQSGDLYAVYGTRRLRHVFAAQVDYVAAQRRRRALEREGGSLAAAERRVRRTRAAWLEVRRSLPDVQRTAGLAEDVTPRPSPTPLPVVGALEPKRRTRALMIAHQLGWLTYVQPLPDDRHLIEVDGLQRELPGPGVLPYVLGFGDARQMGGRVAYREDLG